MLGLRCLAVGLVLLLLTPYNKGTFFNWAHMSVGIVMALVKARHREPVDEAPPVLAGVGALTVQLSAACGPVLRCPTGVSRICWWAS